MLYAVYYEAFDPGTRVRRTGAVVVEAEGGDDAVSKGSVDVAALTNGAGFRIVGVMPAADVPGLAGPAGVIEGDDAPEEDAPPVAVSEPEDAVAAEKAELIAEAKMRGIAVDGRWGVARLREALG